MATPFDACDAAFEPFYEPLLWIQRRGQKQSFIVKGVVFHERKQIEAYSSMQGVIKRYSDTWTVRIPLDETRVCSFERSDTLTRQTFSGDVLTIQSITKEDNDWVIAVTGIQEVG